MGEYLFEIIWILEISFNIKISIIDVEPKVWLIKLRMLAYS